MKRNIGLILAALAAVFLPGCIGGSGGSSAPAPTNVKVTPKDSRVVVTWDATPGVQYWIFKASGSGVTPQNCSSMPLCNTAINATSPYSFTTLMYNGYLYSFSINGRTGGGPGGSGSAAVETTPRLAGATWATATATNTVAPGTNDLRGVAFGNTKFVAAGANNALYSGLATVLADGKGTGAITWTDLTSTSANLAPATRFNAVSYNASPAKHFVAGAGGTILQSADAAVTWTKVADSKTTNELFALANNGTGFVVAVGAGGTIVTTGDAGTTWATQTSGTTNALNGVAYGYGNANATVALAAGYRFVAVGDAGTLLWSSDGVTWNNVTSASITTQNLKAVTSGYDTAGIYHFIAVGANGTVLDSMDGVTWTLQPASGSVATANLTSVAYSTGRRFVVVSDAGQVFYSETIAPSLPTTWTPTWTQATSPATSPLYSVTLGGLFDFAAVGASGLNLYAD